MTIGDVTTYQQFYIKFFTFVFLCATEFDFITAFDVENLLIRGQLPIPQQLLYNFIVTEDGVNEDTEGFVLLLEVPESELDERDVGRIDLERSSYLVRINPSGIVVACVFTMYGKQNVR